MESKGNNTQETPLTVPSQDSDGSMAAALETQNEHQNLVTETDVVTSLSGSNSDASKDPYRN